MNKKTSEYFHTDTSPVRVEDIRRETGLPAQHAQQRRTILPVVALGAVFTLMFVGVFSLGFYVGSQTIDTNPGKQSGQVFEKHLTQPLSENAPGYVEPKAPLEIRKAD